MFGWILLSIDAKTAFLQARLSDSAPVERRRRPLVMEPPRQGNPLKKNEIFIMDNNKDLYGTRGAPLSWCRSFVSRYKEKDFEKSQFDEMCLFRKSSRNTLMAILGIHVDDAIATAEDEKLILDIDVELGAIDRKEFRLCGAFYKQNQNCSEIYVTMEPYLSLLSEVEFQKSDVTPEALSRQFERKCRSLVGQLLWLSKHRLDIAKRVQEAAEKVTTWEGLKAANKCVRYLRHASDQFGEIGITYKRLF